MGGQSGHILNEAVSDLSRSITPSKADNAELASLGSLASWLFYFHVYFHDSNAHHILFG